MSARRTCFVTRPPCRDARVKAFAAASDLEADALASRLRAEMTGSVVESSDAGLISRCARETRAWAAAIPILVGRCTWARWSSDRELQKPLRLPIDGWANDNRTRT